MRPTQQTPLVATAAVVAQGETVTLEDLVTDNLQLRVKPEPEKNSVCVTWLGRANDRRPAEVLNPFFEQLVAHAESTGDHIEFRFEQLEHFNSSTIAVLMHLIRDLKGKSVRMTFVYDASLKWQKMTFEALKPFAGPDRPLTLQTV